MMVKASESFTMRRAAERPATGDQEQAIANWSTAGFDKDIRAGQRPDDERLLEEFVGQSQYRSAMYRGIRTETPLDLAVGDVIDQKGLSSWTAKKNVAEIYASVPIMTSNYEMVKGTRYLFVLDKGSKHSRSLFNGEDENAEVLMSGTVKQRVTRITETSPGEFTVYLEDMTR